MENPVQGYVFDSFQEGNPRNETICRIVKRAVVSDAALREGGPAFVVEFGDGQRETAYWLELHPWYPT